MSHPFEPIHWKLARAYAHANKAEVIAKRFLHTQFYGSKPYRDRKGRLVFRLQQCDPMPVQFGIIIGESFHQARSALDHLMFLIAKPISEQERKGVQFPLYETPHKFRSHATKSMIRAPRGVRTIIERLQPYHRRQECRNLGKLKVIDDWDKHRLVMSAAASGRLIDMDLRPRKAVESVEFFPGVFKPGVLVARIKFVDGFDDSKVTMQPEFEFLPVFDQGMPKEVRLEAPIKLLFSIVECIKAEILPKLERFVLP